MEHDDLDRVPIYTDKCSKGRENAARVAAVKVPRPGRGSGLRPLTIRHPWKGPGVQQSRGAGRSRRERLPGAAHSCRRLDRPALLRSSLTLQKPAERPQAFSSVQAADRVEIGLSGLLEALAHKQEEPGVIVPSSSR